MTTHAQRLARLALSTASVVPLALLAACGGFDGRGGSTESVTPVAEGPFGAVGDVAQVVADPYANAMFALSSSTAGSTLFWADSGDLNPPAVRYTTLPAGAPETLTIPGAQSTDSVDDIAADGANVYVILVSTSPGSVESRLLALPQTGGPATELASATGYLFDLTVVGDTVYFTDGSSLYAVPTTGTDWKYIQKNADPNQLFDPIAGLGSHDGVVYWTLRTPPSGTTESQELDDPGAFLDGVSGLLYSLAGSTAQPAEVATVPGGGDPLIAANDRDLFWLTTPKSANMGQDSTSYVIHAPIAGGAPAALGSVAGLVGGIVADDANVYVLFAHALGGEQTLVAIPVAGGATNTLVSGITAPPGANPGHALALDGQYVYFADANGVERAPL